MKKTLHVFRRDLRLDDNTALLSALKSSDQVFVVFVFDPRQLEAHPYRSLYGLQFLLQSLKELADDIEKKGGKLSFFYGDPAEILPRVCQKNDINNIVWNRDYTPFSQERDNNITDVLKDFTSVHTFGDALLTEPEQIRNQQGDPYKVYSAFSRECRNYGVAVPKHFPKEACLGTLAKCECEITLDDISQKYIPSENTYVKDLGARSQALKILEQIHDFKGYQKDRDFPSIEGTTRLSPHHKFGTISVRETFHAVKNTFGTDHTLINELYWRDFYTHVAWHYPGVFVEESWNPKYKNVVWDKNDTALEQWKKGRTGFPIVDAGMRELRETGHMHNRVRMITACFLVKDLHIHWREGEQHFAQYLVDYDPCVNNGSWQWAASTGTDAQPYFRIFNPWNQQKRWDADCEYIKQWIHDLRDFTPKEIHNWQNQKHETSLFSEEVYPAPILDHKVEAEIAKQRFKQA